MGKSENGGCISFSSWSVRSEGGSGERLYVPIPATELHIYQSSVIING